LTGLLSAQGGRAYCCGFLNESIVSLDKLRFSLPEDKKITKLLGHEAIAINASEKNIDANNLKTGRVLGREAVGEGAAARMNVLSLAIRNGMNIYSLAQTEMAYCPMVAENYDVLNKAADFAVRRLEKSK
jgi:hypothetical protein